MNNQSAAAGGYPSMPAYEPMTSVDEAQAPKRPGAWMRFLSFLIDSVLVSLASTPAIYFVTTPQEIMDWFAEASKGETFSNPPGQWFLILVTLVVWFVYRAAMESSKMKASVGKLLTGQRVVNFEGGRITFTQSLIRNSYYLINAVLGLILSLLGFIYYIIYGVTIARDQYNQSHTDKWAKAYVIKA